WRGFIRFSPWQGFSSTNGETTTTLSPRRFRRRSEGVTARRAFSCTAADGCLTAPASFSRLQGSSPRNPDGKKDPRMADKRTLFTSESVTEGHPDKIADQISDAILDAILRDDPAGRVACETLVTTGMAFIAGEITTKTYVDIPEIVRSTIREVGYTRAKYGF